MLLFCRYVMMLILASLAYVPGSAFAQDTKLLTKYSISFLGLNVGKMANSYVLSDKAYTISGGVRTNAVVSLVADTKAYFESKGRISGTRLVPANHKLDYRSNKKKGGVKFKYADGNIVAVSSAPKVRYKPGAIPVVAAHKMNVLDPVSSLLFPVMPKDIGKGNKICNRVVPVFDGKARMNLVLRYKSKRLVKAKGFRGEAFTCAVRYQPVSGIRPFKKHIKFMKANRDMEISLARVGESNVYALFGFRVRTNRGMASGKAYHFAQY